MPKRPERVAAEKLATRFDYDRPIGPIWDHWMSPDRALEVWKTQQKRKAELDERKQRTKLQRERERQQPPKITSTAHFQPGRYSGGPFNQVSCRDCGVSNISDRTAHDTFHRRVASGPTMFLETLEILFGGT